MSIDISIGNLSQIEIVHSADENGTSCILSDVNDPSNKCVCYADENGVYRYNENDHIFNPRSKIKCTISSNSLSPIRLDGQLDEEVSVNIIRSPVSTGSMKDEFSSLISKTSKINSIVPINSENFDWVNTSYDILIVGKNPPIQPAVVKDKYDSSSKKKKKSKNVDLIEPYHYNDVHMNINAVSDLSIAVVNNFGNLTVDLHGKSKDDFNKQQHSDSFSKLMTMCGDSDKKYINFGCFNGSKGLNSKTIAHDMDYLLFTGGQNSRCEYDYVKSYMNISLGLKDRLIGYNFTNLENSEFYHLFKPENLTSIFSTFQRVWKEICSVEQLQTDANNSTILRMIHILNSAICYYSDGVKHNPESARAIEFNTLIRVRNEISIVLSQLLKSSYLNPENPSGDHNLMYDVAARIRSILNDGILGKGKVYVQSSNENILRSELIKRFSNECFHDSTKSDRQKLFDDIFSRSRDLVDSFSNMFLYFTGNKEDALFESGEKSHDTPELAFSEHNFSTLENEHKMREQMLRS